MSFNFFNDVDNVGLTKGLFDSLKTIWAAPGS